MKFVFSIFNRCFYDSECNCLGLREVTCRVFTQRFLCEPCSSVLVVLEIAWLVRQFRKDGYKYGAITCLYFKVVTREAFDL